jgi:membrane dipeptidase
MGITDQRCMVKGSDLVNIDDVVDHYDHIRDLVGIEHIAVGSDAGIENLAPPDVLKEFNVHTDSRYNLHGEREMVAGMEGPARMYELVAALIRRGYTDEHVRLVIAGNWA